MSSHSSILERYRLQTYSLPPDKVMHLLSSEQTGDANAQVLYKKRSGSAGQLGGGSFGTVHLEYQDSECAAVPHVRAVKTISKAIAEKSSVHWQQEIENLITLSKVISHPVMGSTLSHAASSPNCSSRFLAGGKMTSPSISQWNISKPAISQGAKNRFEAKTTSG